MANIDTPDFQRGVVSAQKLLATVSGASNNVTIGVPPNAETLVVIVPGGPGLPIPDAIVVGETTGVAFPGVRAQTTFNGTYFFVSYHDVSQALDADVTVSTSQAPGQDWWVYSDSHAHTFVDMVAAATTGGQDTPAPPRIMQVGGQNAGNIYAQAVTKFGQAYVSPGAPSTAAGDHPPVELNAIVSVVNSTSAPTAIPAPPAGQRIRLFAVNAGAASSWIALGPFGVGPWFVCSEGTTLNLALPLSGVVLPVDTAFEVTGAGAAGTTAIAGGVYTYETV